MAAINNQGGPIDAVAITAFARGDFAAAVLLRPAFEELAVAHYNKEFKIQTPDGPRSISFTTVRNELVHKSCLVTAVRDVFQLSPTTVFEQVLPNLLLDPLIKRYPNTCALADWVDHQVILRHSTLIDDLIGVAKEVLLLTLPRHFKGTVAKDQISLNERNNPDLTVSVRVFMTHQRAHPPKKEPEPVTTMFAIGVHLDLAMKIRGQRLRDYIKTQKMELQEGELRLRIVYKENGKVTAKVDSHQSGSVQSCISRAQDAADVISQLLGCYPFLRNLAACQPTPLLPYYRWSFRICPVPLKSLREPFIGQVVPWADARFRHFRQWQQTSKRLQLAVSQALSSPDGQSRKDFAAEFGRMKVQSRRRLGGSEEESSDDYDSDSDYDDGYDYDWGYDYDCDEVVQKFQKGQRYLEHHEPKGKYPRKVKRDEERQECRVISVYTEIIT